MGNYLGSCPEPFTQLLISAGMIGHNGNHPDGITINGISYSTVKLIGEGGYAYVYEGFNNATGQRVAIKRYVFSGDSQYQDTNEEIDIYRSISSNDNIVAYYDSEVITRANASLPETWVVMEYCEGPSLQDYINNRIQLSQSFSVREVYEIVDNVVRAIGHLHTQSPPISHWDIKPDNFLFTQSGVLKLCDFGSASRVYYEPKKAAQISAAQDELNNKMTLLYRPPESLDLWSKQKIDTKADIWSLGVLIYVLVFCEMPFEASIVEIIDGVPKRYRTDDASACPEPFVPLMSTVMEKMLVKDPQKRADIFSVSEALSKITKLDPLARPPAGQISQSPRF